MIGPRCYICYVKLCDWSAVLYLLCDWSIMNTNVTSILPVRLWPSGLTTERFKRKALRTCATAMIYSVGILTPLGPFSECLDSTLCIITSRPNNFSMKNKQCLKLCPIKPQFSLAPQEDLYGGDTPA